MPASRAPFYPNFLAVTFTGPVSAEEATGTISVPPGGRKTRFKRAKKRDRKRLAIHPSSFVFPSAFRPPPSFPSPARKFETVGLMPR